MPVDFQPESDQAIDFQPEETATAGPAALRPVTGPIPVPPEFDPTTLRKRYLGPYSGGPTSPYFPEQMQEAVSTIAAPYRAAGAVLGGITGDVSELASDFLRRTGINPAATAGEPMLNVPRIPVVPPLDVLAPKTGQAIEEAAGRLVSGFTEPGQAALLPFAGLRPVQGLFGAQAALQVPESIQQLYQAKGAPEVAGRTFEALANLGMGYGIGKHLAGEVPPPAMGKETDAQAIRGDKEVGTQTGQEPQGSQAHRGGDVEQAAPGPTQPVETRKEGGPEVLLLNQASANNRSLGIGHEVEVLPDFGPQDKEHIRVFRALPPNPDGTPGKIQMSTAAFNKWLSKVPEKERASAVQTALAEEGIHSTVTPEQALAYLQTLSPAEVALGKKLYLGDRTAEEAGLTPANLGHELLRQRLQRILRMRPTELAEVAGRERWSRASLEFISRMIGKVRGLLRTDAAKEGQKIVNGLLDTYQRNIASLTGEKLTAAAYRDPHTGQVYAGQHHPAIMEALGKEGFESRESRNTPDFGFSTNLRPFVSRTEAAGIAEGSGQKLEHFDVNDQEQPQPHSNEVASPSDPEKPLSEQETPPDTQGEMPFLIRRKEDLPPLIPGDKLVTVEREDGSRYVAAFGGKHWDLSFMGRGKVPSIAVPVNDSWSHGVLPKGEKVIEDGGESALKQAEERGGSPAMIRRKADKEHPELYLPPAGPEAASGPRPGLKQATPDAVHREGYGVLTQATDAATEEHLAGKKPSPPSFAEFSKQMQLTFGEMNPAALADAWATTVWNRLQNASGETLGALRAALDMRHKLGTRDIPNPAHVPQRTPELSVPPGSFPELVEEARQQRESTKEARAMRISADRYRNNVIAQIGEKLIAQSAKAYNLTRKEITPEDVAYGAKSVRPAFNEIGPDERANPGLLGTVLTDDARQMGIKVSATKRLTVLQNRSTGKVEMVSTYRDPRRGAVLMDPDSPGRTHSPLASILKRWRPVVSVLLTEPVKDFQQSFSSLGDFEDRFGSAARSARQAGANYQAPQTVFIPPQESPNAWASRVPITEPEARAVLSKVLEEGRTLDSPEDAKLALQSLRSTTAKDRLAISGLKKLAARLEAANPNETAEGLLNKLAQTIYDNHKAATSTEDFQRRTMESGRPPTVPAPGAVPQAARIATRAADQAAQARIARALSGQGSEADVLEAAGAQSPADLDNVPAMIRRTAEATAQEVKLVYEDVRDILRAGTVSHQVSAAADAADNVANNTARRAEFGIRLQSVHRPGSTLKRWFTAWQHGNPDVLAAANVIVEAQGVMDSGAIHIGNVRAAIPGFRAKVAKGRAQAEVMAKSQSFRERRIGKAWLRACDQYDRELNYADAHLQDPDLKLTAGRVKLALDAQYNLERSAGYDLAKDPTYVPHRYDVELWSGRSIAFQRGKFLGLKFREAKRFKTHYDAIEQGPYLPVTRDSASLVSHRIRQGTQMMLRDAWRKGLESVILPNGRPLAVRPVRRTATTWGSPSSAYVAIPQGGGAAPPLIVHEDFESLIRNLTGRNVIHDWALTRGALNISQNLKHTLLMGDFFHLGRVVYYAAGIQRTLTPKSKGAWSALEIEPRDAADAIQRGVISRSDAAWANEPVKFGSQQINRRTLARMFESEAGLNIGKIQDALYKDLATKLSPTAGPIRRGFVAVTDPSVGRYNRFLFDRLSRGLMLESAVRQFEEQSKANPDVDPRLLMGDIAKDVNVFFGNIGRQGWFKGAWQQDLARMFLLAPQWVEGLIKKEATSYTRYGGTVARAFGANYRQGLPALGTIGTGMGRGLLFMFALTQAVNLLTRRKPTWENPEKEHRFDAWIPGWGSDSSGFWLSPLALFNEITHDVYRLVEDKPKWTDAIDQIAGNKESPLVRGAIVFWTSRSPTGTYLTTAGSHIGTTLEQLAPVPITFSRYARGLAHMAAPGLVQANLPGQVQRQVFSTIGLKVEPARSPLQEAQKLARDFAESQKHFDPIHQEDTDQPSYSRLRSAVRAGDEAAAWKVLDQLRAHNKKDADILKAMLAWRDRPYTWSRQAEADFRYSLTPEQREVLAEATYQKMREYQAFLQMYQNQPAK